MWREVCIVTAAESRAFPPSLGCFSRRNYVLQFLSSKEGISVYTLRHDNEQIFNLNLTLLLKLCSSVFLFKLKNCEFSFRTPEADFKGDHAYK